MDTATVPKIEPLISAEEMKLTLLTRRLFALEAFLNELERVTRKKTFQIWNSIVWRMVLDSRDAFVIHLASWARGMYEKGGFLRQIQAHCLRDLRRNWKPGSNTLQDKWFHEYLAAGHEKSFARLFPDVSKPFPRPDDIEKLRNKFVSTFEEVTADRDGNRAHPFERGEPRKMLNLVELRAAVTQAERFLADVRLVTCCSSFSFHDMNETSAESAAEELVDAILVDHLSRRRGEPLPSKRDEYYDELHRVHDEAGHPEHFNDVVRRANPAFPGVEPDGPSARGLTPRR
jgi:hypothetical protein